jgi:ADP-heptose:LPS heptosyltransferase
LQYRLKLIVRRLALLAIRIYGRLVAGLSSRVYRKNIKKLYIVCEPALGIGDILMLSPGLRLLAKEYSVVVLSKYDNLFAEHVNINWQRFKESSEIIQVIASANAATELLIFPRYGKTLFIFLIMRARHKVAFTALTSERSFIKSGEFATHSIRAKHYSDKFLAQIESLLACETAKGLVRLKPRCDTFRVPDDYIVVAPFAGFDLRMWTVAGWCELLSELIRKDQGMQVVFVGSSAEQVYIQSGRYFGKCCTIRINALKS